jgi:(p)ppGpp synthase/HD superfamily hydrolase
MYKYAQTNIQLYRELQSAGYSPDLLRHVRSVYELACLLHSAQYRASGKPFVCHLVGTASILAAHGAPPPVVIAGLLHFVYLGANFGSIRKEITHGKRRMVRDVVGDEADKLIKGFTNFRWNAEIAEQVVEEFDGFDEFKRSLVFMRIANELDEAITGDILFEPEKRRMNKVRGLPSCGKLAAALGKPELAKEIIEVFQAIPESDLPEELVSQRSGPYLLAPLSHKARIGPWSAQVTKSLYRHSPRWLRTFLRARLSVGGR